MKYRKTVAILNLRAKDIQNGAQTDTIGFLLIITKIPNNIAIIYNRSKLNTL